MAGEDAFDGRRPSYNSRGQIRGFRTRPGAPQAQPTQLYGNNFGTTLQGTTPQSNWDSMFRNFVTGKTPSDLARERAGGAVASGASDIAADEQFGGGTGTGPTPSLEIMAQGGTANHAQRWSNPPPLRGLDRSMPADPFMPRPPTDPFLVPRGTMSLAGDKSLYAPGGTASLWSSKPDNSGWTTTSPGQAQAIQNRYGWGQAFDNTNG